MPLVDTADSSLRDTIAAAVAQGVDEALRRMGKRTPVPKEWLSATEAAQYMGLVPATISRWRREKRGPKFFVFSNKLRVRKTDLDIFIAAGGCK